jgi:hypothetical protein
MGTDAAGPPGQTAGREVDSTPLIVEDNTVELRPGQMKKTQFLAQLKGAVCATAEDALAGTIWSSQGCPWIEHWFSYYGNRDGAHIERAIRKYVAQSGSIESAADYIPLISSRVRRSITAWADTGEVPSIPEELSSAIPSQPAAPAGATQGPVLQRKGNADGAAENSDPQSVQAQLGPGYQLDGSVRSRMEPLLGHDLSRVRVHTDAVASDLSQDLDARAFTIGSHVAFRSGEYHPGTPIGDALIAHELAHVVQQRDAVQASSQARLTETEYSTLEKDADQSAVGTVLSLMGQTNAHLKNVRRNALPRMKSGLRLQRCSMVRVPDNLRTPAEKAAWISQTMKEDKSGAGRAIVEVFKSVESPSESPSEFIEIQEHLDMSAVIGYLSDWDAVQVGALGPLLEGAEKLNQKRAEFIVEISHDYGIARAQVFVVFMFNAMFSDDMKSVLRLLADDKRMGATIEHMPEVKKIIAERGISLDEYKDRGSTFGDFFRGLGRGFKDFFRSSEIERGKTATRYYGRKEALPPEYQAILSEIERLEVEQAMTPGNILLGGVDYLTFGIPMGLYGLVAGTVGGVGDLARGDYEKAGYKLTGAVMVLGTYLGVRTYRAATKPKPSTTTVLGPEGSGQFQIKGFQGPIPKEVARLGAILELNAQGQAVGGLLISRYGQQGVIDLARYVQADSKAAVLVYQRGVPALDALRQTGGDAARASALLGPKPAAAGGAATQNILVVGAETAAEFAYARQAAAGNAQVTVVNPRTTAASKEFQRNGGNFVEGRIESLPRDRTYHLIREDFPYPLGRAYPPTAQFVVERLDRLAPGGRWVVVTESAEFAATVRAAAEMKGARVTTRPIPAHHEGAPQSSYPREPTRQTMIIEAE